MRIYRQIKHEAGVVLMMRKWTMVLSLVVALPLTILTNDYFAYQNVVWAYVGHFLTIEVGAYFVGRRLTFLHGAYELFQKKKLVYLRLRRSLSYMRQPVDDNPSLEEERQVLYENYYKKFRSMKRDLKFLKSCTTAAT